MTYQELMQRAAEGALSFHHDAWCSGYISRKTARDESYPVYSYNGRFGSGYVVYKPSFKSTRYHIVEYYIYNQPKRRVNHTRPTNKPKRNNIMKKHNIEIVKMLREKVTELMNTNTAAVLDSFYANGTCGSYRMIFEPKGFKVWLEEDSYFIREFDIIKLGWESQIGEESNYFEALYYVTSDTIVEVSEEIAKDWEATQERFCPDK